MPKTKTPVNMFKTMRNELGISQESAARLLRVSVMTVSRWERGLFDIPAEAFMLTAIAKGKPPKPCTDGRKIGFDTEKLAAHLPDCEQCREALTYLRLMAKP